MMRTARIVDTPSVVALDSANHTILQDATSLNPSPDLSALRQPRSVESVAQARVAGRMNAAAVSEEEVKSLLAERASLLQKKYETSLTPVENRRLTYVRWSLDRIEDARKGMQLDLLESRVTEYEAFLDEIRSLNDQISNLGRNSSS